MALQDYILPEVFNPYVIHRTNELSALVQSGIVAPSAELDRLASTGGKLINMPYWEDLTGDDEVLTYDGALTPGKIQAGQDVAALLIRGKAWKSPDLQAALSGSDPMAAIGDLVAGYWARRRQKTLLSILKGIFGAASMSDNIYQYTTFDKTNAAEEILTAAYKLGDAQTKITGILCNSADALKIDIQNMLSNNSQYFSQYTSDGRTVGRRIIVDDGVEAGTLYLFGEGAIGLGNGSLPVMTETDRDSLGGYDVLVNRQSFILHPRGVQFKSTSVSGLTPSNTELENQANWERVYEAKDVRIIKMKNSD